MSELNLSQQSHIFPPSCSRPVTVIGAGSVGSWVITQLAKMGVGDITVYDGDSVESHNIPASAYRQCDLGFFKVVAIKKIVLEQSGLVLNTISSMYKGEKIKGTVVACVDNMEARSLIWSQVKNNPNVDIFVDTRTATELISVFAIDPCNPEDIVYYESFLYPSNKAATQQCGEHGIVFVSSIAASAVCANLTNFWKNARKRRHFQKLCVELENIT